MSDNGEVKFIWKDAKNEQLKAKRNISFEQVLEAIAEGRITDIVENPSPKYAGQKVYILELNQYPHFVPFKDIDGETRELISIIPSRKLKKKKRSDHDDKSKAT